MEKLGIIMGGLVFITLVITVGSCSYFQIKICNDTKIEAIKAGNEVLAASIRCGYNNNNN